MDFFNIYFKNKYLNESYSFIKENYPNKINIFIENINIAEKETFKTLIIAIIKERVLNFTSPLLILFPNKINTIQFTNKEQNEIVTYEISLNINDVFAFNYFTFEHPVNFRKISNSIKNQDDSEVKILDNCIDLVNLFKFNSFLKDIEDYKLEIIHSISNIALVNTLCKFSFAKKVEFNWKYLSDYVDYNVKLDPFFDKYLFYSKFHKVSHHTHPTRKNRMGLSCVEMIKYSNEFGNEIKLPIIGLHRSVAIYQFIDDILDPTDYFLNSFPALKQPVLNHLKDINLKIEDYLIYPVHSFSASKLNPLDYAYEFKENLLIIFPQDINIPTFSTESFRSMVPKMKENKEIIPDLKLSVPVRVSGSFRILSLLGLRIIPISKILSKILEIEPKFKDKFKVIKEFGGICHKDGFKACMKYNILSIVYKDNINLYINSKDEQPISSCFLFNQSPMYEDKTTILKDIILQYQENNNLTLHLSIISWYTKYIKLLLESTLILLTKYGISVEAHLQNSVFIYLKGEPIRLVIRDWLATRFKFDRLENHKSKIHGISFHIPFYEGIYLDFYSLFMSSILYSHIGQLNILISQEFKDEQTISYNELWRITYETMKSIFREMKNDCDPNHIKEDEEVLFNSTISFNTSGIINRLTTDTNIWQVIDRKNPLVDN